MQDFVECKVYFAKKLRYGLSLLLFLQFVNKEKAFLEVCKNAVNDLTTQILPNYSDHRRNTIIER